MIPKILLNIVVFTTIMSGIGLLGYMCFAIVRDLYKLVKEKTEC